MPTAGNAAAHVDDHLRMAAYMGTDGILAALSDELFERAGRGGEHHSEGNGTTTDANVLHHVERNEVALEVWLFYMAKGV